MPETIIPDVSEFQNLIDWPNLGADAAIVRLCYGDLHVDAQADRNIEGARRRCRVRGWYCYLVAGRDPAAQADTFCRVLQAHGGLQPGEFIVCDDEEGSGDESGRVNAFLDRCDAALRTPNPAGEDWWYAGLFWALAHNLQAARGHRWIAAYQASEPTAVPHDLWQRTDAASIAGIAGPVDASIYHGSIDDLAALITGGRFMAALTDTEQQELLGTVRGIQSLLIWSPDGPYGPAGEVVHPTIATIKDVYNLIAYKLEPEVLAAVKAAVDGLATAQAAAKAELDAVQAALQGSGGAVDLSKVYAAQARQEAELARLGKHLGVDVTAGA